MALMQLDQVGLPAGVPGFARRDGLDNGAVVTVTDLTPGGTTLFEILWAAEGQSRSSLHATAGDSHVWQFTPASVGGAGNPIRIRLTHTSTANVVTTQTRIFGIANSLGVVPPAPGELADPNASLLNATDPAVIDRCERNWPTERFPLGQPFGWGEDVLALADSASRVDAGAGLTRVGTTLAVGANADGSIIVGANDIRVGVLGDAQHGSRGGSGLHANAVAAGAAGFMSGSDKAKLDGVSAGATATQLASMAPTSVGTTNATGLLTIAARADHVHAHGEQTDGSHHAAVAPNGAAGFMTGSDKAKLDAVEPGAQVVTEPRVRASLAAASADVSLNGRRLTSVADPTLPQDAATKAYVDALSQGLDVKASVRVVAISNIAPLSGLQTIDGVALATGDRVLVAGQTDTTQNGIYVASAGVWTRALDASSTGAVTAGMFSFVTEGAFADTGWVLASNDPITVGSTPLVFTQFSGAGLVVAGAGLTKSGNTLDVVANPDGSIAVAADSIQVGVLATDAQHGSRGGGSQHATAVAGGAAGFLTGADKTKLDSVATGATATLMASIVPVAITRAAGAVGVSSTAARSDHKHDVTTASPSTVGAANAEGTSLALARADHVHDHGALAGGTAHAVATTAVAGFMSSTDKTKLDGMTAGPSEVTVAGAGLTKTSSTLDVIAHADGSIVVGADDVRVGVLASDAQHGSRGGGALHAAAVAGGTAGFLTGADKTKLDSVANGATATPLSSSAPASVGTAAAGAAATASRSDHVHDHGSLGGGALHATATGSVAGFMSATDKTRLDAVYSYAAPLAVAAPLTVGTANAVGTSSTASRDDHVHAHGAQTDGSLHAAAVAGGAAGFLTGADKTKLDGIETGAQATTAARVLAALAAAAADVSINSRKLTNVLDPTSAQDAATKAYVDSVVQGLDVKASCRAVATSNITLSGLQTVDGVSLAAADRVLVAGQTSAAQNGIYVVAAGAWARSPDANTSARVTAGLYTFITEGTLYGDSGWLLTTNDAITLDTTALALTQFSGAGQITAGAGLTKFGNTIDVVAANGSIVVAADSLAVGYSASNPAAVGAAAAGAAVTAARSDHVHAHGAQSADATMHAAATTSIAGFMSSADKTKLDGVATGATAVAFSSTTPAAVGTAAVGAGTTAARADHVHAHGAQGADGTHHAAATTSVAGFMSSTDKTKLDGVATGATTTPLSSTAPVAVTRASADIGVGTTAARADHKHDVTTAAPIAIRDIGQSSLEGSSTALARADHAHPHGAVTWGPSNEFSAAHYPVGLTADSAGMMTTAMLAKLNTLYPSVASAIGRVTVDAVLETPAVVPWAAAISLDTSQKNDFEIATLGGNTVITLDSPAAGRQGFIAVRQPSSLPNSYTVSIVAAGGAFVPSRDATTPTLLAATGASAVTIYSYMMTAVGNILLIGRITPVAA